MCCDLNRVLREEVVMEVIADSWLATLVVASTSTSRCVLLDRRACPSGVQNRLCFRHDCETDVRAYLTIFGSKIPLRVQSLYPLCWWLFREGDLTLRKVVRCFGSLGFQNRFGMR